MSDLPRGWDWSTIGEIATVQLGRQRSPKNHIGPHMRPYLRSANVTWGGIDITDVKEMNFAPAEAVTFELRDGDILLNEASGSPGEVGKPAIWRNEIPGACFQNTLLRVRSGEMDEGFLYWYFYNAAFTGRFGEAGRGVNIRHLGKHGLSSFRIPIPPLPEQRRIVAAIEEHFSRLDAAEAGLRQSRGRCLLALEQIVNVELQDFEIAPLEEFCEPGGITDGPFGSNLKSSHYVDAGPRVVRLENLGRGLFVEEQTHIRSDHFERLRKHEVLAGDLLVASLYSDRLRACVAPDDLGPAIVKADCIRLRPAAGNSSEYLTYALCRSQVDAWCQDQLSGVGRQRLGLKSVRQLPVPKLDTKSQETFLERVGAAASIIGNAGIEIDRAIDRVATLRRSILVAAFSGRLVSQDPSDELASVLLERIAAERVAAKPSQGKKHAP